MTNQETAQLSQSFRDDYEHLRREFDKLERADSFQGPQMEALTRRFLEKWERHMEEACEWPEEVRGVLKQVNLSKCSHYESLEDDLRLVNQLGVRQKPVEDRAATYWTNYNLPELEAHASEPRQLVGDVYRRACEASYLRVTYNKARLGQEDERREPVRLGQRALRYDPHSPKTCLWYSVTLGWCLDAVSNPRERTLAGETFKQATKRTLAMVPHEPLARHLLGIYNFHVGGLNWFQRSIAKSLLGCKVEGSLADSEHQFRLAYELKDDWLPTGLWMAKVLLAQNRPLDEVRLWVKRSLALEANEPTTILDRQELCELARKLKITPD